MRKKILAGFLTLVLAISGVMIMPNNTEAAEQTSVYYDEQGTYKMSDYWSESNKKVPVLDGYVFGGWFVKESDNKYTPLRQTNLTNDSVKSISAIAKFVPADVLSVKTQLATETTSGTTKAFLRLLSTTDASNYQKVGFEYQLGSRAVADKEMTKIYSAIKPSKNSDEILYPSTSFAEASKYFIAVDINNITESSFASIVYARAYWVTMDGTKVMGLARNNRVEDKQNDYTSASVTLLTDGIAPATVAAGKVVMTYNTTDYDVVVDGGNYKVDTGRLHSEMEFHVNETAGTITFVGNAKNIGDKVVADGLYANVRFEKKTNNNAALNFEVKTETTMFCDWLENVVNAVSVQ